MPRGPVERCSLGHAAFEAPSTLVQPATTFHLKLRRVIREWAAKYDEGNRACDFINAAGFPWAAAKCLVASVPSVQCPYLNYLW